MTEANAGNLQEYLEGLVYVYFKQHENEVLRALVCGLSNAGLLSSGDDGEELAGEILALATNRRDPLLAFGVAHTVSNALVELACYFGFDDGHKMVMLMFSHHTETKSCYFVAEPKPVPKPAKMSVPVLVLRAAKRYSLSSGKLVG